MINGQSLLSRTGGVEYCVSAWQPQKLAEGLRNLCRVGLTEIDGASGGLEREQVR